MSPDLGIEKLHFSHVLGMEPLLNERHFLPLGLEPKER
jgi:hypothetical protein